MLSEFPENEQRYVVCQSKLDTYGAVKISFDYDGTLTTDKGKELAKNTEGDIYIISARQSRTGMLSTARSLNIPISRVYAMGSNKAKIEKIKELRISKHYDNNHDVIKQLENIGIQFTSYLNAESYNDYPDSVSNNAKRGIELNDKVNNKCATQVGKVRAQQLANKEKVSIDTIQRMYSYLSRAETYYDESNTEACGTISYLLWGGKAGLNWSRKKLRELGLLNE
jgi:hydroxymethylpyrimidine pyrophosphatase-like HAD family hydrolase